MDLRELKEKAPEVWKRVTASVPGLMETLMEDKGTPIDLRELKEKAPEVWERVTATYSKVAKEEE